MDRLTVSEQVMLCTACELHGRASGPIPFRGKTPTAIAVISEAPSKDEDDRGRLGVGPEALFLSGLLEKAEFDPEALFFANTVSCYPAGDLARSHVSACRANLEMQLELSQARWVLLFGAAALSTVRPDLKIGHTRGHALVTAGRVYLVSLHPGIRSEAGRKALLDDLRLFRRIVSEDRWTLAETSCVACGLDEEDIGDHDMALRFDEMGAAYCGECWPQAPENQREAKAVVKEQRTLERHQTKTGQLFG